MSGGTAPQPDFMTRGSVVKASQVLTFVVFEGKKTSVYMKEGETRMCALGN